MPHSQEVSTNSRVEAVNSFTSPRRLASQPVSGTAMALATPKEVITQVPWLVAAPRLPEMVGKATLAMVVSSTCMNTDIDSASVIQTSLEPVNGG